MVKLLGCEVVGSDASVAAPCGVDAFGAALSPTLFEASLPDPTNSLYAVDWTTFQLVFGTVVGSLIAVYAFSWGAGVVIAALRK